MNLFKKIPIYFILLICFIASCKSTTGNNSQKVEEIFSLNTTSCYGPCPVFNLMIYGDKRLVFEGKENTDLSGEHEKQLTDDQFDALMAIVESADWANLEEEYRSDMTDLPTQNFMYNRNGVIKKVMRYGAGPESISNLSDTILTFVEEQIFSEKTND
ncbi:DUF6438 domain-containing protein [Marivirga arenosa]|uniref:DUF6438 domain-containing protein n=1 Tax=Marivirga arenosa TaxID=3059076 RepID=A0AA49JDS9_9BACT|nr:DUF6438 domain-containing protein [Marivirga sp. ABR2-2]WKK86856.1 DUF6438 domain-containing protein [Marivirga sp. ABR2-2]